MAFPPPNDPFFSGGGGSPQSPNIEQRLAQIELKLDLIISCLGKDWAANGVGQPTPTPVAPGVIGVKAHMEIMKANMRCAVLQTENTELKLMVDYLTQQHTASPAGAGVPCGAQPWCEKCMGPESVSDRTDTRSSSQPTTDPNQQSTSSTGPVPSFTTPNTMRDATATHNDPDRPGAPDGQGHEPPAQQPEPQKQQDGLRTQPYTPTSDIVDHVPPDPSQAKEAPAPVRQSPLQSTGLKSRKFTSMGSYSSSARPSQTSTKPSADGPGRSPAGSQGTQPKGTAPRTGTTNTGGGTKEQ